MQGIVSDMFLRLTLESKLKLGLTVDSRLKLRLILESELKFGLTVESRLKVEADGEFNLS